MTNVWISFNSHVNLWRNKKKDPQRITKIKSFKITYKCERTNYLSEKDDWTIIDKNNETTALNVFYAKIYIYIYPSYASKQNSNRRKQLIFLII